MRNIALARMDDRLIHGEVVTAWTLSPNANGIAIVDDTAVADKFNRRVLITLAPQGTKVAMLSVEGVTKALQKPDPGNERAIALTEIPVVFEQPLDSGAEIKEVRPGSAGIHEDRRPFVNNVSASPDEVDSIRCMKNKKDVNVYCQLVPEQKIVDISDPL